MSHCCTGLIPIILISIYSVESFNRAYVVSKDGRDVAECGNYTNPCGTMYYASTLINNAPIADDYSASFYTMYIMDGQNRSQIEQYQKLSKFFNTNNPCIPKKFEKSNYYNMAGIAISFDSNNISTLNDWYPLDICSKQNTNKYDNQYLFNAGSYVINLVINNLIIDNYIITNALNYPIINCDICGGISINNSSFFNVSSNSTAPLFYLNPAAGSCIVLQGKFINITATSHANNQLQYNPTQRNELEFE
eukprot:279709_1